MIAAYLAAPVTPLKGETLAGNLAQAKLWYRDLSACYRNRVFVADWILHVEAFAGTKDDDLAMRQLGMRRNFFQIQFCLEFWMVGHRMGDGMRAELETAVSRRLSVIDWTGRCFRTFPNWIETS